jgi:PAS domain S-box-containing protein
MADSVLVYDVAGNIVHTNAAARRLFGYDTRPDFYQRPPSERGDAYGLRDAAGRPITGERLPIQRVLAGEVLVSGEAEDYQMRALDGRQLLVNLTGSPVRDDAGAIVGAVIVARDVGAQRQLERARERAIAQERDARAEADLAQAQLRAILDVLPIALSIADSHGKLLHQNPAVSALWGAAPHADDVGGYGQYQAFWPGTTQPLRGEDRALAATLLRGEVVKDQEVDILTFTGERKTILTSAAPVRDEHGAITGGVSASVDVTERRRLERQLAEQASQFRAVFDAMADGVFVYDRARRVLRMNPAARADLATRFADPDSHTLEDLRRVYTPLDEHGNPLHPDYWPFEKVMDGETLQGSWLSDLMLPGANGDDRYVSVSAAPIRGTDGGFAGVVLVVRDLTERRHLERRTREALDALLAVARELVTPDTLPTADLRVGGDTLEVRLAQLTRRVLGCRRVGILGIEPETRALRPVAVDGLSPEQTRQWWAEMDHSTARFGEWLDPAQLERFMMGETIELDLTAPPYDKFPNPHRITTSFFAPLRLGQTVIGLLVLDFGGAPHQVTPEERALTAAMAQLAALVLDRERLQREAAAAQAETLALALSNERLNAFLAIAGHELRTPVTSVKATIQLAARTASGLGAVDLPAPDRARLQRVADLLATADSQVSKLNRLIEDLLDVTRVQSGTLALRRAMVDVAATAREVLREQQLAWGQRPITLEAPPTPATAEVDGDRIAQVITNYLTNALKYSPPDSPVVVSVEKRADMVRVTVRDEGPGLSKRQQAQLWGLFQRVADIAQQDDARQGLGIGLYICRAIIEQHGGQVGVESRVGRGSAFWFTVPAGHTAATGE